MQLHKLVGSDVSISGVATKPGRDLLTVNNNGLL